MSSTDDRSTSMDISPPSSPLGVTTPAHDAAPDVSAPAQQSTHEPSTEDKPSDGEVTFDQVNAEHDPSKSNAGEEPIRDKESPIENEDTINEEDEDHAPMDALLKTITCQLLRVIHDKLMREGEKGLSPGEVDYIYNCLNDTSEAEDELLALILPYLTNHPKHHGYDLITWCSKQSNYGILLQFLKERVNDESGAFPYTPPDDSDGLMACQTLIEMLEGRQMGGEEA